MSWIPLPMRALLSPPSRLDQLPAGALSRRFALLPRVLVRPRPGFYVLRLTRGGPLVPALIFQLCPMVVPQPALVGGPHPDEWCRPLDRSVCYRARIDGKPASIELVWAARSLQPVSPAEYQFRIGVLRHWARAYPTMPEARPRQSISALSLPSIKGKADGPPRSLDA